jgi:hypothetical protein
VVEEQERFGVDFLRRLLVPVLVTAIAAAGACGGSGTSPGSATCAGQETCACLPMKLCNAGLLCLSNLCVSPSAGAGGMSVPGGGGAAGKGVGGGTGGIPASGGAGGTIVTSAGGAAGTTPASGGGDTGSTSSVGGAAGEASVATGGAAGAASSTGGAAGATSNTGGTAGATLNTGGAAGGGGGGGGGAAGSSTGGTGGSPPGPCGALIDDMENGTGNICQGNGRTGHWFDYHDAMSTLTPDNAIPAPDVISPPRGTSTRAMHFSGTFVQYAGGGCFLDMPPSTYNANGYTGIQFWMKGTASAFKVIVQTAETEATTYGGTCTLATLSCAGNELALPDLAADAWALAQVPFTALGMGTAPFDQSIIWSIEFQSGPGAFDFWVDDLGFY